MENKANSLPTLSLTMIVKNEEANLERSLSSVKNDVDEIIVVDTGSSDSTKVIAEKLGAKIYDFEWKDDFSAARNFAIEHSTMDWVLVLDADEEINEVSRGKLKEALVNVKDKVNALFVEVTNTEVGSIFPSMRLMRNNGSVCYARRVHENISPTVNGKTVIVDSTDIQLSHFGYVEDPAVMRAKSLRNLKILEEALKQDPENVVDLYFYALILPNLGRTEEAFSICEQLLEDPSPAPGSHAQVMAFYLELLGKAHKFNKIVESVRKYNTLMNYNPEIAYFYGAAASALGQFDEAYRAFSFCLENEREGLKHGNLMPLNFGTRVKEGIMMLDLRTGNQARAKEMAVDILRSTPDNTAAKTVLLTTNDDLTNNAPNG